MIGLIIKWTLYVMLVLVAGSALVFTLCIIVPFGVASADSPSELEANQHSGSSLHLQEDDPGFDCRTMGNQLCGVEVNGTWYVLDFGTSTFANR